MSTVSDFFAQFDEEGRYYEKNGSVGVVFTTFGGTSIPGTFHFQDGLCVRAEIERGGEWVNADGSPLGKLHFFLHFPGEAMQRIMIDEGRVIHVGAANKDSTKGKFLENLRRARNLFAHGSKQPVTSFLGTHISADLNARGAVWLTLNAVEGFDVTDFPELGKTLQGKLRVAVDEYTHAVGGAPEGTNGDSLEAVSRSFLEILRLLLHHIPPLEGSGSVEAVLQEMTFPDWVANWDYDLDEDSGGVPAVWVKVIADMSRMPPNQLGRLVMNLNEQVYSSLAEAGIGRQVYIRLKSTLEHKAG